jgi:tetratricopeptide (TPR) repeat protein
MLLRVRVLLLLSVAAAGLTATSAHADVAAAREHFRKGKVLYDLQRYLEAAKEYEAAYEAKDDPALLFNIGQSYRLAHETQKALGAYRAYLRNVPDARNQPEVQSHIDALQQALDAQRGSQPPPVTNPTPTEAPPPPARPVEVVPAPAPLPVTTAPRDDRRPRTLRISGIAIGVVGVAALATGLALELIAKSDNDQLSHPAKGAIFDPNLNSAVKNDQAAGIALLAVGGAALATGATLIALGYRHRHAPMAMVAPAVAPGLAVLTFSGRF